jgi:hypothetical protein
VQEHHGLRSVSRFPFFSDSVPACTARGRAGNRKLGRPYSVL